MEDLRFSKGHTEAEPSRSVEFIWHLSKPSRALFQWLCAGEIRQITYQDLPWHFKLHTGSSNRDYTYSNVSSILKSYLFWAATVTPSRRQWQQIAKQQLASPGSPDTFSTPDVYLISPYVLIDDLGNNRRNGGCLKEITFRAWQSTCNQWSFSDGRRGPLRPTVFGEAYVGFGTLRVLDRWCFLPRWAGRSFFVSSKMFITLE